MHAHLAFSETSGMDAMDICNIFFLGKGKLKCLRTHISKRHFSKILKVKKRVYMIFRYHLSFKCLINTAVAIFFVKRGTDPISINVRSNQNMHQPEHTQNS